MVQLSYLSMASGKTIALTICMFVGKVMSLLLNTLYSFVIIFLLRRKRLLISWLQSPSAVNSEPKKIKSAIVATFSPSICLEVMGLDINYRELRIWVSRADTGVKGETHKGMKDGEPL